MVGLIGQKIGQYEITAFIGRGGMSNVYRARQASVGRDVAIKVLSDRLDPDEPFYQRFEREVRIIAGLEHIHILPIYDYGQYDGHPYLVMRYLDGGSLHARIGKRPLPLPEVERLIGQICNALDFAHEHDVVHRDMKPHNVLLDKQGNAYLCDFGIAKQVGSEGGLTQTGQAVGTPNYMAPEQWQGLTVDRRTDVYALGVLLYEMLIGETPFPGDNIFSVMYRHLNDSPPLPSMRRPELPPALDMVIQQAMEKLPTERYETAGALAQAVSAAMHINNPSLMLNVAPPPLAAPASDDAPTDIVIKGGTTLTGRTWVLDAFTQWVASTDESPIFYLVGPHGMGKSTLATRFAEMLGQRVIRYELVAALARSLDPRAFVHALACQLAEILPDSAPGNPEDPIQEAAAEPVSAFEERVLEPIGGEDRPIYVVIDSLDLAFDHAGMTIADVVRGAMANWPEALRMIITAVPGTPLDALMRRAHRVELSPDSDVNRADLHSTLTTRFATLLPNLSAGDIDLLALEEKAEGSPLYLNTVLEHLLFKRITPADLASLPPGLEALYQYLIERAKAMDVLRVMAVARAPLSARLLAQIMGISLAEMTMRLGKIRPLVANSGTTWTLAHPALRQMLLLSGEIEAAHLRIVSAFAGQSLSQLDIYALQHLPAHLVLSNQIENAYLALTDLNFLIARLSRLAFAEIVDDYDLLRRALGKADTAGRDDPRLSALDAVVAALGDAANLVASEAGAVFGHLYNALIRIPALRAPLEDAAASHRSPWLRRIWPITQTAEAAMWWQGAPILALASQGGTVLAICADGYARQWTHEESQRGLRLTREWNPHGDGALTGCALRGDGRAALTASSDGTAKVWDMADGTCTQVFNEHQRAVNGCALNNDGSRSLTASDDRLLRLWDTQTGKLLAAFHEHPEAVTSCGFADGDRVGISGGADGMVRTWDAAANKLLRVLKGHRGAVTSCAGVVGLPLALTGGSDGQVCVWDVRSGSLVRILKAPSVVTSLTVTDKGLVIAGCEDGSAYVWEMANGELRAVLEGQAVCTTREPSLAIVTGTRTGERTGTLRAWTLLGESGQVVEMHGAAVTACTFTPDSQQMITASADREIRVWDAATGRTLLAMRGHTGVVNGVATDGRVVLSASGDKTLRLWEIHRGTMIRMLTGHADPVTACALSQRAHRVGGKTVRLVASGDSRQLIRLWDADSGQAVANLKGHGRGITGCAFSPVDELLASTSLDGTAAFWSLENGGIVKAIDCATEAGASYPTTCAFSPDGRLLLIGQSDGRLWAYHRGEDSQVTIRPSSNDSQGIVACGFSSDGRLVFAAARSGEVRIWDVSDLAQPKAIAVHFARHALTASALAPDNAALGLGDTRGAVMLLRLESGARRKIRLL